MNSTGCTILNRGGWSERIVGYTGILQKPIYEVTLDRTEPLMCMLPGGWLLLPNWRLRTDWGSVPALVQALPGYDRARFVGYLFHDAGYLMGGLWLRAPHASVAEFISMSKLDLDKLLFNMIVADGGRYTQARAIYASVLVGGWPRWIAARRKRTKMFEPEVLGNAFRAS